MGEASQVGSPVALVLLAVVLVAGLAGAAVRSPLVGLVAIAGTFLLSTLVLPGTVILQVGPISLYLPDLAFAALAAATSARVLRTRLTLPLVLLLGFSVLALANALRGVPVFGVEPTGVEFRETFYFLVAAIYCSALKTSRTAMQSLRWLWLSVAAVLVAFAAARWLLVAVGALIPPPDWGGAGGFQLRVLNAAQALVLVQAWVIVIISWTLARGMRAAWVIASVVLLTAVLVLQHRSVWVVLLGLGLIVAALEARSRRILVVSAVGLAVVAGAAVAASLALGEGVLPESLRASLAEATSTTRSTFVWRIEGWSQLLRLDQISSAIEIMIGKPFGSGYAREIRGATVTVSPHNYYVQTLLRGGLVGLGLLLGLYAYLIWGMRRSGGGDDAGLPLNRVVLTMLAGQLIYFVAYSPNLEQGIWLGLAVALADARSNGKRGTA